MTTKTILPQPASTYQLLLDAARAWPDGIATQWIPDPADHTRCLAWTYGELARISPPGAELPGPRPDDGWIDVRLADDETPAGLRALVADPALTVLVRPDRVVAAVGTRSRLPRLSWYIPAAAGPERPATASPAAQPESASPVPTTTP